MPQTIDVTGLSPEAIRAVQNSDGSRENIYDRSCE